MPDTQQLVDDRGVIHDVPEEQVAAALAGGYRQPTQADTARLSSEAAKEQDYGGAGGAAKAAGYAALRGATVGLSDIGFRALGAKPEDLRGYQEANPRLSQASEFIGALAPSFVAPESLLSRTPAGQVSRIGKAIAEGAEHGGAGFVGRTAASAAGAAIEGGIYGGGQYLSQVAIEDKPLAAEGFFGAVGKGALWAAPVGGALSVAGEALTRAKSLFPRSQVSREAAQAADREATTTFGQSVRDGDDMVRRARQRIALVEAHAGQAQAGEQAARTVFGDAGDAAIADQVSAGAERQQLVDAVDEYTKSRQALAEWVQSEADPDLEAALVGLQAPSVQTGAPNLRTPEFGEVVPPTPNRTDLGEFGLERTSVGKRIAQGTPVTTAHPELSKTGEFEPPIGLESRAPSEVAADITRAGKKPQQLELPKAANGGEPPVIEPAEAAPEVPKAPVSAPGPTKSADIPIEKMSKEQIEQLQDRLNKEFDNFDPSSREYVELSKQWDRAVARRIAIENGATEEWASKVAGPPALSEDEFDAISNSWRSALPEDVGQAFKQYSGNGLYSHINGPLRSGEKLAPELQDIADKIQRGIESSRIPRETTVYRGVSGVRSTDQWNGAKVGDEILDPAFGSTSTQEHVGHSYSAGFGVRPGVELRITLTEGFPAAPIPSDTFGSEREILLPRNTKYKVTAIEERPGGKVVHVTASNEAAGKSAGASAGAPQDDLEALLRGTKQKLDRGEDIASIGAPARDAYRATKAAKTAKDAEHFRSQAIEKHEVPEFSALEKKLDDDGLDYVEQTISAKKIAERGYYEPPGGGTDPVRNENARKAIAEGQREAVKLNVSPTGKITVTDGRHRLAAAIEADKPIKVKWSTGFEPAKEDVLRSGRSRVPDVATGPEAELEALLRGTKAGLDSGKSLGELSKSGAPSVASPGGTADIDALVADVLGAPGIASKTGEASGIGDLEKVLSAIDISPGSKADAASATRPRDVAKTIVDKSIKPSMERLREEALIEKALRKHAGKNVDIGADLTRAARVIGDHEAASANLAEALGPDAPTTAAQRAQAYRAATAAHADASASSAVRTASDLTEKAGPALADTTRVDDGISAALRKYDAKRIPEDARAADRAVNSLLGEQSAGAAASATAKAPHGRGALETAADIGTALEVLHALGVNTPDIKAIPVIGPVLSLYLKARALLGIVGRKGGSIGRTAESEIASKSAVVRDRVNAAAREALDVGARGVKRAGPIAGPAGALAYKLFPGDGNTTSKDPRVLYDARIDELTRAQAPGAIEHAISDRFRASDPNLQDAITQQAQRASAFLLSKAPKPGLVASLIPGDGRWHPSRAQLDEFAKYVAAVHDPAGVLEDIAHGHATIEGAETLRVVYPRLYAEAQRTLLEHASQFQRTLPYRRRVAISLMYGVPVDVTMSVQHLQYLAAPSPGQQQAPGPAAAPPQVPVLTAPLQTGQQTLTATERRAGA